MGATDERENEASRPVLRVVKGSATPEEIAAIVAVVSAMAAPAPTASARPRSQWSHPARQMRSTPVAGVGAWRASGLPH